jgi:2,3-bisphosphoglycerate-dependent phosphoglycerate mutase
MAKRALAWIRHGEYSQPAGVPSAHLPYGLTPRGRDQARSAAHAVWAYAREQRLELAPVVDCSSLLRAWETATLLVDELRAAGGPSLSVESFDALTERSLGAAANLTIEQIEAVLADDPRYEVPPRGWKRDPAYRLPFPGAESLEEAGRRVLSHVLDRMRSTGASAPTLKLFVGHGGAFRHAAQRGGLLTPVQVHELSMDYGVPIYLEQSGEGADGERLAHVAGGWKRRSEAAPLD